MVNEFGKNGYQTSDSGNPAECASLRLHISPGRIHFLKFILEGYDGLGILSTIEVGRGLVEIRYPPETEEDLQMLLADINDELIK